MHAGPFELGPRVQGPVSRIAGVNEVFWEEEVLLAVNIYQRGSFFKLFYVYLPCSSPFSKDLYFTR